MPKKTMAAFVEALGRDEILMCRLRDRVGGRQGDQAILAMVDLAARHGFEIFFADARALRDRIFAEAGDVHDGGDRDLDNDEVAGLAAGVAGRGGDTGKGAAALPARLPSGLVDLVRRW